MSNHCISALYCVRMLDLKTAFCWVYKISTWVKVLATKPEVLRGTPWKEGMKAIAAL